MNENNIKPDSFEMNQNQMRMNKRKEDPKPLIAGILLIIAAVMGMLTWIAALSFDFSMIDQSMINQSMMQTQNVTITPEQIENMIQICATIGIILSVFPLLGGILSIQKKFWGGALGCSIIGLFTIGPLFISSILALISLILLVISKEQFYKTNEKMNYEY